MRREGVTGERDPSTIGFCHHPRRRHRRRPHGAVRRHRRAHRDQPQGSQPRHLRPGQPARRALPGRPATRPVRHERRARAWADRMQGLDAVLGPGRRHRPRGGGAAAGDVGQRLGGDSLEGLGCCTARAATSPVPCRPSGPPTRWTPAAPSFGAFDREAACCCRCWTPATRRTAASTLAAARHAATRSSPAGCATRCTAAWRTCSSARCCWPRSAARALHRPVRHGLGHLPRADQHLRWPARITIDKVSGPVGEALIMTAAGLAVAIPAVLAYNLFGKWVARLRGRAGRFCARSARDGAR